MAGDELPEFPDEYLIPRGGCIYGKPGEWAVIVALQPFDLDDEIVRTQITIDAFPWEVTHPRELAGTTHEITADDRDELGIEGSVYLRHAHHPVDVSRISFGDADADTIHATIDLEIDFDTEGGGFANRTARIACQLTCGTPKGGEGINSFRVIR